MRLYFVALALLPLAAGCSAIGAGDYVIYRVASSEPTASADCFPAGPNIDDAEDTTTFRTGDTFVIYGGIDASLFLEVGDDTLEGTKGDGAMTFSGQTVDIEYFGTNDASQTNNTQTLTITMDPAGAAVSGTTNSSVVQTCTGAGCSDFDSFSCSGSSSFIGTRVNGVELEHTVPVPL